MTKSHEGHSDGVEKVISPEINALSFATLNCSSRVPHLSEIKLLIATKNLHVLAQTETWCSNKIAAQQLDIEDYNLVRNYRGLINLDSYRDTWGGGVDLYIDKPLKIFTQFIARSGLTALEMLNIWH